MRNQNQETEQNVVEQSSVAEMSDHAEKKESHVAKTVGERKRRLNLKTDAAQNVRENEKAKEDNPNLIKSESRYDSNGFFCA